MNPRNVMHLLRTDVRRLRWLLAVTLLLFTVDFILCLYASGWRVAGARGMVSDEGYRSTPPQVWGGGVIPALLLAGAVGWQGLAWSRTRPVRRSEAAAAKVGFIVFFLILPQAVMVMTAHLWHGIPLRDALTGMLAAAGVFIPLWCIAGALGRLAGSGAAFFTGLLFIGVVAGIAALFDERMIVQFWMPLGDLWGRYAGPHSWCYLGTCAAGLLLLVPLISRRWKTASRLAATAFVMTGSAYYWRLTDWFQVDDSALDVASVEPELMNKITPVPPPKGFSATESRENGMRGISVNGSFATAGLPPGVFAWWQPSGEAMLRSGGQVIARARNRQVRAGRPQISSLFPPRETKTDSDAVLAALPPDSRLVKEREPSGIQFATFSGAPSSLGVFEPVEPSVWLSEREVSLEADLTALLYRYEVVADAPAAREFSAQRGAMQMLVRFGDVSFTGDPMGVSAHRRSVQADIVVRCPAPGISSSPLTVNWRISPFSAWRVFLYNPADGLAAEGRPVYQVSSPLLGGAGAHRAVYGFENSGMPVSGVGSDARVIILEPKFLGGVNRRIVTPPAVLRTTDWAANDYYDLTQRTPDAGPIRPETATREEFAAWLRTRIYEGFQTAVEGELAPWVRTWPDVILNITPLDRTSEPEWCRAVARALPDARREDVIRRLPKAPWFAWVVQRRGWEKEARKELLELCRSGLELNKAALLSIASLEEPETYDMLLGYLEANGESDLYGVLHRLPGIEPKLTASVRRYFAGVTINGREPGGNPEASQFRIRRFGMPIRHGIREALSDALALYRWEHAWMAIRSEANAANVMMYLLAPPHLQPGTKETCDFLARLKAEDCRFDPVTRRWITPGVNY